MKRNGWIALGNPEGYLKRLEIKVSAHPIKHQNENWFTFSEKKTSNSPNDWIEGPRPTKKQFYGRPKTLSHQESSPGKVSFPNFG